MGNLTSLLILVAHLAGLDTGSLKSMAFDALKALVVDNVLAPKMKSDKTINEGAAKLHKNGHDLLPGVPPTEKQAADFVHRALFHCWEGVVKHGSPADGARDAFNSQVEARVGVADLVGKDTEEGMRVVAEAQIAVLADIRVPTL